MNTLSVQLVCLVAITFFIVCFRMLGVGFKPFAAGMLLIIIVWVVTALMAIFSFVKLAMTGHLATLSMAGTVTSVMALCFLAWFGFTVYQGSRVPPIHHISTDLSNPPVFDKISTIRAVGHNSLDYTDEIAQQQRQSYGHIQPLLLNIPPEQVFDGALLVVDRLGWQLQSQDSQAGVIEASARSGIFGFVDDVVIRIEARGEVTQVDMRSVSRVGKSDFGANAKRIRQFLALLAAEYEI